MKKAILVLAFSLIVYQWLKEKQVADKWRQQERKEELARIAAENDPFWAEIKAEMEERKKVRKLMEEASAIVYNYVENDEEF